MYPTNSKAVINIKRVILNTSHKLYIYHGFTSSISSIFLLLESRIYIIRLLTAIPSPYLPCMLPLSLPTSSSSSLPSKQRPLLLTLNSELALLLVARGESETLTVLLLVLAGPDLTLYIEDAGIFVINGRRLPGILRLISICLIAISRDFFDSVLPKPELSGDDPDFPDILGECLSSCFGGASFRIFITLSTIFVPITTGLTLSLTLLCPRLTAGTELPLLWILPFGARPLAGEQDCRLGLPLEAAASTEEDLALGAPGLPLEAETGLLSGSDVLKFGGASREKPGMSDGFQGLDFTVGETPRDGTEFLDDVGPTLALGPDFVIEEDLTGGADILGMIEGVDGRRVGVDALEVDLDDGMEDGLDVGVDDLAVDLEVGVEDLGGTVGLDEVKVGREVGVVALEGLEEEVVNVGRLVGVAGLDPGPPADEGLRVPAEVKPGDEVGCLGTKLLLTAGSGSAFANLDFKAVGRALGVPIWLMMVFCDSISKEGKRGVPGGVRSQS